MPGSLDDIAQGMAAEQTAPPPMPKPQPTPLVADESVAPSDPLGDVASQMKAEQDQEAELQANLLHYRAANDKAEPGKRADVLLHSAATGLTPDFVEENLDAVREQVKAANVDWKQVVHRQPGLVRMLQETPQAMPLVKDDAANLGGVEWALSAPFHAWWDAVNEQRATFRQFVEATGAAGSGSDNRAAIRDLQRQFSGKDYGESGAWSTGTIAIARMAPYIGLDLLSRGVGGSLGAFIAGGEGAAATAETGPGAAGGGAVGAVAGVGLGQFVGAGIFNYYEALGPNYERLSQLKDATGEPLDPDIVQAAAQGSAVTSGLLMGGFAGKLGGSLAKPFLARFGAAAVEKALTDASVASLMKRGVGEFGKHWLTGATLMAAQSAANQAAVNLAEDVSGRPFDDRGSVADAASQGFVGGLKDMWLLSAIGAGREVIGEVGRARASAEGAARYEVLAEKSAESKLLERSPELYEKALAQMKRDPAAAKNVSIPAERWTEYWQDKKLDPGQVAGELMGDGGKAFSEAMATKGDLIIPAEKYFAKLGKTEHVKGLAQDAKLFADDLTPRQFADEQKARAVQLEQAAKARAPELEHGKAEVQAFIRDMAVKAGHDRAEANAVAKTVADHVAAMAVRLNVSVPEAAARGNLGGLRILGPRGERVIQAAQERFGRFVRPSAERFFEQRLTTMSPEARAREAFVDSTTGLHEREVFDQTPVPEGRQVAVITSPDVKGINDHPTAGGHNVANDMMRAAGAAIGAEHPEAARGGTNFVLHVKDQAELDQVLARARKGLGNENLNLVGAVGETADKAFSALDKATEQARAEKRLPARGGLNPGLDVARLAFGPERGNAAVPEALVHEVRGLSNRAYAERFYVDKVKVGDKEVATGLLTKKAWEALPRKAHAAMVDAKGLKAVNERFGKEAGNRLLLHIADTFAHLGGSSFDGTHLSGDEFAFQHDDPARLDRFLARVREALKDYGLEATDPATGKSEVVPVDFRHGIGTDLDTADRELNVRKRAEAEVPGAHAVQGQAGDGLRGRPGDRAAEVQGAPAEGRSETGRGLALGAAGEVGGADSGLAPASGSDRGRGVLPGAVRPAARDSAGPASTEGIADLPVSARRRGATRPFQREEVVAHVEGKPVVLSHGTGEADTSFEFGQNELTKQAGEYVSGIKDPEKAAYAKAWLDFTTGVTSERPSTKGVPVETLREVERELAKFGAVDPEGFAMNEAGRDLSATAENRRSDHRPKGEQPDSLREAAHNRSGAWWMKLKQLPRPEQSLENMQAQRAFNEFAMEHGAAEVSSTELLLEQLDKAATTYAHTHDDWVVVSNFGEKNFGTDAGAARDFIENPGKGHDGRERFVLGVYARKASGGEVEDRIRAAKQASRDSAERVGLNPFVGDELDHDVQPAIANDQVLSETPPYASPEAKLPESKNLPGQAEAEQATSVGGLGSILKVWKLEEPEGYTGKVKLESGGRSPGDRARGTISLQLDPTGRPRAFDVTAFAGDKSTLMHETAHFLSWSFHDIAESDLATEQVRSDYRDLLKWAGFSSVKDRLFKAKQVEELQQKGELTPGEERKLRALTAGEERISHGFEQYLLEGKAPNAGLARVFSRFRGWLMGIYRGVEGLQRQYRENYGQELGLSNEARDIFGRLLGQDDALSQARSDTGAAVEGPRPPPLPTASMTPAEREAYFAALQASHVTAERELAQRTAQMHGEEVADLRGRVTKEVAQELDRQQVYRAERYLQHGELVDGQGNPVVEVPDTLLDEKGRTFKLERAAFIRRFGKDVANVMPPGVLAKEGVAADELAPLLGYQDGADMVDAFKTVEPRDGLLARRTQERVSATFAPAYRDMAKAAMSAVHNEHSAVATLLEVRALAKLVDPALAARTQAIDLRLMRTAAVRLIDEKGIGDLDPDAYARAERQAAVRAAALWASDKPAAIEQRVSRLFNQMLYRAARDAADKAERVEAKLEATSQDVRANLGKADPSYRDVHDAILHAVGLGPPPTGKLGLEALVAKATADGHRLDFDMDGIKKVLEGEYDWGQLSVAEARNVADAITNIRHVARATLELDLAGKRVGKAAFLQSVAERVASVQPPQPPMPYSRTAEGFRESARRLRRGGQAMLEDVETWAEMMDGGTKGPVHDLLISARIDARTKENELSKQVLRVIKEKWEKVPKDVKKLKDRVVDVAGLLPVKNETLAPIFTRDTLWQLFLNYGSEGNRQRLNDGNGWSNENIEKALQLLTKPELEFLQGVTESIGSLYGELAKAHEKRTGLKLGKVDALPVTINGETYQGGYHPLRYDSRSSTQGERQDINDAKSVSELFGSSYQRPTLPASHTKGRVEKVDAPVDLTWGTVPAHLSQVIRDIAYGDWVRQAGTVLLSPEWKGATTKFLGEERSKQFVPWLRDVANARADSAAGHQSDFQRRIGAAARSRISLMVMGLNLPSLMRHSFDPWSTMSDSEAVAPHHIAGAYLKVINPSNWGRAEYEQSKELANHEAKLNDNLREELGRIGPGGNGPMMRAVTSVAFKAHELVHHFTARVVFTAGYDSAIANGATPEQAVQRGDDVVRRALPSGDIAEKPPILRSKQGWAAAVMFYGYASKMHNLRARAFDAAARTWSNPNSDFSDKAVAIATVAGKWMALGAVASLGAYFAGRSWRKDENPLEWAAEETLFDPVEGVPIIGPAIKKAATGHQVNIANAPELALLEQAFTRVQRLIEKAKSSGSKRDSEKAWGAVEAILTTLGPAGFVQREFADINAQRKHEFRPRGALDQAAGAFYGPPKTNGTSSVNPLQQLQDLSGRR